MRPIEVVLYFIIFQHKIKYTKQQFDLANSCLGNEKGEGDESLKSKVIDLKTLNYQLVALR